MSKAHQADIARQRAEQLFAAPKPKDNAKTEVDAAAEAQRLKMERLKALRLAKAAGG